MARMTMVIMTMVIMTRVIMTMVIMTMVILTRGKTLCCCVCFLSSRHRSLPQSIIA